MELSETLKQKVLAYKASAGKLEPIRQTPILFVVGISGAGKDAVQERLMAKHSDDYRFIVSHTTRKPRANHGVMETDGVEYHFINFGTANDMLDKSEFVEAKLIHFDNIYGTAIAEIAAIQKTQKIALTDVDVKGVAEYVELGMNVKPVFLVPPSYDVWWQRLMSRYEGNVQQQDLQNRLKTALEELEHAMAQDYFYIVINDDLDKTVELVNQIAHGEPVEPHYRKAMEIAEHIATEIKAQLEKLS